MTDDTSPAPAINGLTPEDRLAVSSHAQEIARKVLPLKTPMRRAVLEQVRWLLGEEP